MSRLAPLDKALVLLLVPLWVICFVLAVETQIKGGGTVFFGLSIADDESYPVLTGEYLGSSSPPEVGLLPGDILMRVGDADLRGVGSLGFMVRCHQEDEGNSHVMIAYRRDGERREASLPLDPFSGYMPWVANSFVWAVSALFLLLRARPTPSVRSLFHAAFCLAFVLCLFRGDYVSFWAQAFAQALLFPLLLRFNSLFPDDRATEGRWSRLWPWSFVVLGVIWAATMVTGRWAIGAPLYGGTIGLGAIAVLGILTRKYRRGDPVARRQIRWVVVGAYCSALPFALVAAFAGFNHPFGEFFLASSWALMLFPVSLVISVVRFNLFDVDRVLSAAASYNILLVLLGAGALVVVPHVAEATSDLIGVDPGTGQVVLSLLLAGVVVPTHRRLRPQIDRIFFKERYALDQGIAELLTSLSHCRDAGALTGRVGEGLNGLLRPEVCVVYARVEVSYAPVFVEGRAVPPAFGATSPLIGMLSECHSPLALSDAGRRPDDAPLGPFDRAALETLAAEVVVPVQQGNGLAAFLCLGAKRSGDVYTSTDLSLLGTVAEKVSTELRRFEQDETIREAREMQESLRRYVPGAVAEQLSSGTELTSGEREVTVLFVDIRGYTSFSESREAGEIFSTINRYTETVSEIVRRHGGSVVEFNGDGMMTVFGAPQELAHKERAAVEAGRELVEAVAALPVEGGEALSVGVGIATGKAFVGNIQAVDRMIWSAIGNTTNLAARLQSLTRELEAAVVIDCPTWECAQDAAVVFEKRSDVPIRGRRATQDVYALPMKTEA